MPTKRPPQYQEKGMLSFLIKNSDEELKKIVLKDVLFVPDNSKHLISVSKLREAGDDVSFGEQLKLVFIEVSFPFEVENGLFVWKTFPCSNENCFNVDSLQMWHANMGHNNFFDFRRLPEFVEGMKISDSKIECCEVCELNKSKKQPVPKDCMTRAKEILDIVHRDALGKISPEAVDGYCYAIGFVDSFGRFSKVYFMKTRDEVLDKFKQFCADVGKLGTLVSDGGGEYISNEFKRFCRNQEIRFENSAPYTPQENGKIERIWGTSVAMARCFLDNACLDKKYWTYALNMAFYVKNLLLHSAPEKTAFEMMYNEKPNLSFVKLFGCVALMHIEKPFRKKLDQTSKNGFFLGLLIIVIVI